MRGGVQVWRRGVNGHGLRHATAYALQGGCDAAEVSRQVSAGADAAVGYGPEGAPTVERIVATEAGLQRDRLDQDSLKAWIDAADPLTGEQRGRSITSPEAHLLYDSTINAPKTYSLAGVLHPELRAEFDALMDRITERTVEDWREQLATRRGQGGRQRLGLAQVEVVQLDHERSRSLDPHAHRHLWLNAKVQGADGKWSNVDSQLVFRLQPLVNARGELAARTDARWRSALARHGYSLNDEGEIAELAHLVRPMSKRAQQIERNKQKLEADWREAHPGQELSPRLIESWDRRAWALDRAQKPDELDEDQWRDQVRREIADIDPAVLSERGPRPTEPVHAAEVDRDRLTAHALSWTDQRAVRSQSRFSRVDLRAGATMAVAHLQLTEPPEVLNQLIREVETRALAQCESLAPGPAAEDVKTMRLIDVGETRQKITARAATRAALGDTTPAAVDVIAAAVESIDAERAEEGEQPIKLDGQQIAAARTIAGSAPLVAIEGPAGAGKTTMLTVAERTIRAQGSQMHTVTPTMKAAQVAQAEIGNDSSSLHALLYAHGWRWSEDQGGRTHWSRLSDGDVDVNGQVWHAPTRAIARGDIIVCDEAGMVDLDSMNALLTLADETGARVALVGDPHQVRPVGHSGAMALVQRELPDDAKADLHSIHRFRTAAGDADTAYAEITRDLRSVGSEAKAREVAAWLTHHGYITRCSDDQDQVDAAAAAWVEAHGRGESIAVMADTNEIVTAINDQVQQTRLDRGQLDTTATAPIRDSATAHIGDVVTTRKNNRDAAFTVANREQWTIQNITGAGITLTGGIDNRSETITHEYAREHLSLGYASTVHGAQGVSTRSAVTVLTDTTSAAQLYVGMTRGKYDNRLLVAAPDGTGAAEQITEAMQRDRHDLSDDQLRHVVAAETARAGDPAEPCEPEPQPWRDRPMGDVDEPQWVMDRLTANRDRLTAEARALADQRHLAHHRLTTELTPGRDRAHRDGADALTLATHNRQIEAAQKALTELSEQHKAITAQLNATETTLDQLTSELEYRATMDREQRHREDHEREHAALHSPAWLTDELRRPHGLTANLTAARRELEEARARHTARRDRASLEIDTAAATTADAADYAAQAAAAADAARRSLARIRDEALTGALNTITTEAENLDRIHEAAQRAGLFRRASARRAASDAAAAFIATWGQTPPTEGRSSWLIERASSAVEDRLQATEEHRRAEAAQQRADAAQSAHQRAQRAEDSLARTITDAEKSLRALERDDHDLTREARIRSVMPHEIALKEHRVRAAHFRQRQNQDSNGRPRFDSDNDKPRQRQRF
nr:AAA family ATPase [Helcobacillus sp. ACRRO]